MKSISQYQADLNEERLELAKIQQHVRTNFDSDLETIPSPVHNKDENVPIIEIRDSESEDDNESCPPLVNSPLRSKVKYNPLADSPEAGRKNPRVSSSDRQA